MSFPLQTYRVEVDGVEFHRIQATSADSSVIAVVDLSFASSYSASLRLLHVHAAYRRQGVGRAVVEKACAIARENGCESLGLAVQPENAGAVAFYRSIGFVEAYRYEDGQSVMVMFLNDPAHSRQ